MGHNSIYTRSVIMSVNIPRTYFLYSLQYTSSIFGYCHNSPLESFSSLQGYIYVEAFKQTHVKQAIEGIGNLRLGYWKQQMVPTKEMPDVMKVLKEVTNLKPKMWVRLKKGLYKDDLAQVNTIYFVKLLHHP